MTVPDHGATAAGPGTTSPVPSLSPATVVGTIALLDVAAHAVGVEEVSGMPTLPWWTSVLVAVTLIVCERLHLPSRHSWRLWGTGALLLALSSLPALPHDLLVVASKAIAVATGGAAFFDVDTPWLAVVRNLLVLAAGGVAYQAAVTARRISRGRCGRCGRISSVPPQVGRTALWWPAVIAFLAPVPYIWLKVAWSMGSTVGLADRDYFAGVTFATQGFGDTALLGGVSMVAVVAMAARARGRVVRPVLLGLGTVGSIMLVPVGVLGSLFLAATAVGLMAPPDATVIEAWAFSVVYVSFLAWGAGLLLTTWRYWRTTAAACARHVPYDATCLPRSA